MHGRATPVGDGGKRAGKKIAEERFRRACGASRRQENKP
jgi:hypothetical protein